MNPKVTIDHCQWWSSFFIGAEHVYSIIIIGGVSKAGQHPTVEVFGDFNCSLPNMPYRSGNFLQGPQMFLNDQNEAVICGGNTPESTRSCFRLQSGEWKRDYRILSSDRNHATGFSINGKAYTLGGSYTQNSSDILDFKEGVWKEGPKLIDPQVYSSCGVVISNEEFLLIGGYYGSRKIFKFNAKSEHWSEVGSVQHPRWRHACALYKNKVYISGGLSAKSSVEVLDLDSLTTRVINYHQIGRADHGLGMVHIDGQLRLAAFGGKDFDGVTDTIELFDDDTETWSLSEYKLSQKKMAFGYLSVPSHLICP